MQREFEAIEDGSLVSLGGDARGHEVGIGHRTLGGIEQHLLELTHGDRTELGALVQQRAGFGDQCRISVEGRVGLAGNLGGGVVHRGDVGRGEPLGFAVDPIKRLVTRVDERKKPVSALLRRGGGMRGDGGQPEPGTRQEAFGRSKGELHQSERAGFRAVDKRKTGHRCGRGRRYVLQARGSKQSI